MSKLARQTTMQTQQLLNNVLINADRATMEMPQFFKNASKLVQMIILEKILVIIVSLYVQPDSMQTRTLKNVLKIVQKICLPIQPLRNVWKIAQIHSMLMKV